MADNHSEFLAQVRTFIPSDRIYVDELRRLAWGTDAGFYRLVPKIVIRSDNETEISEILAAASLCRVPVTFRAAGTSLSGQAVSDSVLVVAGKHWEKYSVNEDASQITLEPGIVGAKVNTILSPFKRKFGPDPASIGSCMVGGIVMNNASGMSCGTHANSDRMMISARIVLTDGTILDTGDENSRHAFAIAHPSFVKEIEEIRDEIRADKELYDRIKYKYSIKNVTGLNIYPFVCFDDPFEIIAHLMVGSEGTLGFMSQITMKTLPLAPLRASAMIYFGSITDAAKAVVGIRNADINAAELLDRRSLLSVNDPMLETYGDRDLTTILTETEASTPEELAAKIEAIKKIMEDYDVLPDPKTGEKVHFTSDPAEYSRYWAIRSGIFPSVGGMRKEGTTCLIEDIAFHIEDLPSATADLSALLDKHGYDDSCIYGHALEGNFHFIINQAFNTEAEVSRYETMIRDVAEMVVGKYDGSLKAEHGTGRNMAPFVEYEWGAKAFAIMKRVKSLFDPAGLLNPGVIFNDDPKCFIKNFKALPVLDFDAKEVNKCIECGFCEVNCMSCGFTLSSRTRVVAQREIARLNSLRAQDALTDEQGSYLKKLVKQYAYYGNETCAGDGLCSTSCPMGINIADLTHQIRQRETPSTSLSYKAWNAAANHFSGVKTGLRGVLGLAAVGHAVLGTTVMEEVCKGLHKGINLPLWTAATPKPYNGFRNTISTYPESEKKVVYFPSCINQMMGLPQHQHVVDKPLVDEMVSLLKKAGWQVLFPKDKDKLCCGTLWESKGMPDIADKKTAELEAALLEASENGRYPVLCDQSPCLHRMRQKITSMKLYEPVEFIMTFLRDSLEFHQTDIPVAVHATCSMKLMKLDKKLVELASLCSSKVVVPDGVGCCGFAGDKGMTTPELNAYGLRKLKDQVKGIPVGYSNSRTCEIGLMHNSGVPYVSIAYLVDKCTSVK